VEPTATAPADFRETADQTMAVQLIIGMPARRSAGRHLEA